MARLAPWFRSGGDFWWRFDGRLRGVVDPLIAAGFLRKVLRGVREPAAEQSMSAIKSLDRGPSQRRNYGEQGSSVADHESSGGHGPRSRGRISFCIRDGVIHDLTD